MRKTRFKENVRRKGYGEAHRRICALYACIRRHIKRTMFGGNGYLCIQRLNGVNNSITELFEWDPTEKVATRPMFMQYRVPGQTYALFYTHDGNKNVSEVVHFSRANGVAAHYEYVPFGEVTAQIRQGGIAAYDFATINPWRFSSEYADDASTTVYYNYRHYEPVMGRWLESDPIGIYGGANLYCVVGNSIMNRIDRLGAFFEKIRNWWQGRRCSRAGGIYSNGKCCCGEKNMNFEKNCCVDGVQYSKEGDVVAMEYKVQTGDNLQGGFNLLPMHYWLEWGSDERVDANWMDNTSGLVQYSKVAHTKLGFDPLKPFNPREPKLNREVKVSKCNGEDAAKFLSCLTRVAKNDNGRETNKLCHEYDEWLINHCREESKK